MLITDEQAGQAGDRRDYYKFDMPPRLPELRAIAEAPPSPEGETVNAEAEAAQIYDLTTHNERNQQSPPSMSC